MRRDKYDDDAEECHTATTKMVAADVERSVDSAVETVLH